MYFLHLRRYLFVFLCKAYERFVWRLFSLKCIAPQECLKHEIVFKKRYLHAEPQIYVITYYQLTWSITVDLNKLGQSWLYEDYLGILMSQVNQSKDSFVTAHCKSRLLSTNLSHSTTLTPDRTFSLKFLITCEFFVHLKWSNIASHRKI